jgi:hypothetical protein
VTVWPDGRVVVSRWPRLLWIRERRVANAVATTTPTVDEAHSRHRQELAAAIAKWGVPLLVDDMPSAQAGLKVGSDTFRALMGRTSKIAIALAAMGLAATFVLLIVRI